MKFVTSYTNSRFSLKCVESKVRDSEVFYLHQISIIRKCPKDIMKWRKKIKVQKNFGFISFSQRDICKKKPARYQKYTFLCFQSTHLFMSQKLLHCKSVTAILPFSRVYKIRPEYTVVQLFSFSFKIAMVRKLNFDEF